MCYSYMYMMTEMLILQPAVTIVQNAPPQMVNAQNVILHTM